MGIRQWLRKRWGHDESGDVPPGSSIVESLMRRGDQRVRALGEYDRESYPDELRDALQRRQRVTDALMEIDITDREARIAAIPRLRELIRVYPHPFAFESLVQAHVDSGRWDEARALAYAAEFRRRECARSPHPEIKGEIDHLQTWSADEVEAIREEREGKSSRRKEKAKAEPVPE